MTARHQVSSANVSFFPASPRYPNRVDAFAWKEWIRFLYVDHKAVLTHNTTPVILRSIRISTVRLAAMNATSAPRLDCVSAYASTTHRYADASRSEQLFVNRVQLAFLTISTCRGNFSHALSNRQSLPQLASLCLQQLAHCPFLLIGLLLILRPTIHLPKLQLPVDTTLQQRYSAVARLVDYWVMFSFVVRDRQTYDFT